MTNRESSAFLKRKKKVITSFIDWEKCEILKINGLLFARTCIEQMLYAIVIDNFGIFDFTKETYDKLYDKRKFIERFNKFFSSNNCSYLINRHTDILSEKQKEDIKRIITYGNKAAHQVDEIDELEHARIKDNLHKVIDWFFTTYLKEPGWKENFVDPEINKVSNASHEDLKKIETHLESLIQDIRKSILEQEPKTPKETKKLIIITSSTIGVLLIISLCVYLSKSGSQDKKLGDISTTVMKTTYPINPVSSDLRFSYKPEYAKIKTFFSHLIENNLIDQNSSNKKYCYLDSSKIYEFKKLYPEWMNISNGPESPFLGKLSLVIHVFMQDNDTLPAITYQTRKEDTINLKAIDIKDGVIEESVTFYNLSCDPHSINYSLQNFRNAKIEIWLYYETQREIDRKSPPALNKIWLNFGPKSTYHLLLEEKDIKICSWSPQSLQKFPHKAGTIVWPNPEKTALVIYEIQLTSDLFDKQFNQFEK